LDLPITIYVDEDEDDDGSLMYDVRATTTNGVCGLTYDRAVAASCDVDL